MDNLLSAADGFRRNPFHEMNIRQFFGEMNKFILSACPDTNLKRLRVATFLQDALARLSGVPVRMIQHYVHNPFPLLIQIV